MTKSIEAKNLVDIQKSMMTCTYCGFCKSVCPVFEDIKWDSSVARGRVILSYGLLEKEIPMDPSVVESIFQCTTCMDCERRCPSNIEVVEIVERCRKDLVENGGILPRHEKIMERILEFGNPYGETESVPEVFDFQPKRANIGYFVGCTSAYRNKGIAEATLSILNKTGEDFTLVDEVCCGSVMQRVGWNDQHLIELMEENVETIEDMGIEEMVFSCAGCYRMFKEEYPRFVDVNFKVSHISEFLAEKDLDIKPLAKKVTYHDPCHLGRHSDVYDAPREILHRIPEVDFKEMQRNRETSRCCGGGGGVRSAFPELSGNISAGRVREAEIADILVTTCPFCVNNLEMGRECAESDIEIVDLTELIECLIE